MDDYWVAVVWTLLPTIVVSAIFFFVLRSVIRADRNERRRSIFGHRRIKFGCALHDGGQQNLSLGKRFFLKAALFCDALSKLHQFVPSVSPFSGLLGLGGNHLQR